VLADKTYRAVCVQIVRLLKEERERIGVSRYALADKCGLSEQMIGYVERGLRNPSLETALRISSGLEVDLGEIIKRAYRLVLKSTGK